jgi:hypothetical protein
MTSVEVLGRIDELADWDQQLGGHRHGGGNRSISEIPAQADGAGVEGHGRPVGRETARRLSAHRGTLPGRLGLRLNRDSRDFTVFTRESAKDAQEGP